MTVINAQAAAARNRSKFSGITRAIAASEGISVLGMAKRRQQQIDRAAAYRRAHPAKSTRRPLPVVTRPQVEARPQAASKPRVGNAFSSEQQQLLMSLFS
jgi:hypothetical protein